MQELMLFPILISTSKVSLTLRLGGSLNSACKGRYTCNCTGAEKRKPLPPETESAQRDHLPASCGADMVKPVDAIWDLKKKTKWKFQNQNFKVKVKKFWILLQNSFSSKDMFRTFTCQYNKSIMHCRCCLWNEKNIWLMYSIQGDSRWMVF